LVSVHNEDIEGTVPSMKSKTLVLAYLLILSLGTILSLYIPKNEAIAKEAVVIPGDAIRLRILANSDKGSDQALKRQVRDAVNAKISLWVKDLTSLDKAKTVIKSKLPEIQAIAEKVVHDQGANQAVHVKFGKVQFPTKLYGEFLYPAGDYQAILITLGKGEGANWWCVLYPPLCFLDFSNGVAVSDGFEEKKAKAATVSEASVKKATSDEPQASNSTEEMQDASAKSDDNAEMQDASVKSDDNAEMQVASAKDVDNGEMQDASVKSDDNAEMQVSSAKDVDNGEMQDASAKSDDNAEMQTSQDNSVQKVKPADKGLQKHDTAKKAAPVYTAEDEQPVKVKFFIVEMFQKLFE
jgi:stage II sporulation protein R